MAEDDKDKKFTPDETQKRFDTALRGARITGHKPMSEVSPNRVTKKPKAKKKPGKKAGLP